jgi:predicted enzyme related to lactoylglutathione lyase
MSGRVVHFEIPADDVDRARDFYHRAFGWDFGPIPELDYTLVQTAASDEQGMPTERGAINGGMCRREPPVTAPVVTIEVEDIDAALRTVESLGGATVAAKQPVADMGFAAYFRDSEGNLMGLWQCAR